MLQIRSFVFLKMIAPQVKFSYYLHIFMSKYVNADKFILHNRQVLKFFLEQ